ncbi:hypothetical protein, partial [Thermogemmatispora sp.]|uniref:hypothetical protein n=1 Tax=Thermogemmatispora sp. TaxID=1968838 RepID=UPI002ACBDAB9
VISTRRDSLRSRPILLLFCWLTGLAQLGSLWLDDEEKAYTTVSSSSSSSKEEWGKVAMA